MVELPLSVGASVAVILIALLAARVFQLRDPLIPVSQLTRAVLLGLCLGTPFMLEELEMLPVAGDWDIVAALALSLGLFLLIARIIGVSDGVESEARGAP